MKTHGPLLLKRILLTVVLVNPLLFLSGCQWVDEKVCADGQIPVHDARGGDNCVPINQPIPSGYMTYPPGQTPTL